MDQAALQAAISSSFRLWPLYVKLVTGPSLATTRREARVAGWLDPPVAVQASPSQRQVAPSTMTRPDGALAASARTALVAGASARAGAAAKSTAATRRARMREFSYKDRAHPQHRHSPFF